MKKIMMIALLTICAAVGARAESGHISAAGQFAYASKNSMAGLGVQVQYEPIVNWRIAPEFMYYFKNDGLSAYNLNLNVHYVIPTSASIAIYPLVGFSYGHYKAEAFGVNDSEGHCGANVGMGAQYFIKEHLHFFIEERFQIMKDFNQSVSVLGLKYTF